MTSESTPKPPKPPEVHKRGGKESNPIDVWANKFVNWASEEITRRTPDDETRYELLLTAPDGKIYSVRLDGGSPPALEIVLVQS